MSQPMFRFLLAISIFSICAVGVLPQKKPARWLYVALSADGYKYYRTEKIDKLENGYFAFWSRMFRAEGYYRDTYYESDCKTSRFRTLQDHIYSPDDKFVKDQTQPGEPVWMTSPPDTLGELLFSGICKPPVAPKISSPTNLTSSMSKF